METGRNIKTALLIPAFVNEYNGAERTALREFGNSFELLLEEASDFLRANLSDFDPVHNHFLDDELKSQYISYIYSCAVAKTLDEQGIRPPMAAGYSMGVYAAMYYCGALRFTDGLRLIGKAWELITASCQPGEFGMGMIIGLGEDEIIKWCAEDGNTWICNRNNPHTFIISGDNCSVRRILELSAEEGALKANSLRVSKPYHTPLLAGAAQRFGEFLEGFPIQAAMTPYISGMDQSMVRTEQEIRHELSRNISSRMNWLETVKYLFGLGVELFLECGAGDGLTKNNRFIEGRFKSLPASQLRRFIEESVK